MTSISTVWYAVLVNGQPSQVITLTTELHQRDPISPHLYLIYAEGLNSLLNDAKIYSKIKRVKMARGNATISHLFFAYDSIVFCNATTNECMEVQKLLYI